MQKLVGTMEIANNGFRLSKMFHGGFSAPSGISLRSDPPHGGSRSARNLTTDYTDWHRCGAQATWDGDRAANGGVDRFTVRGGSGRGDRPARAHERRRANDGNERRSRASVIGGDGPRSPSCSTDRPPPWRTSLRSEIWFDLVGFTRIYLDCLTGVN